ncbi:hypothetical protein SBOR_8064 [Sclerotinia borealis F-4128]|uniref:Uncharacterized protein n=1 Tax=Sclerotinia borealis (strain F-4128) TaxID=1432307 RepID=W9C734_SCLBF|nr:hypothetical protein SBOR_8064 [Sclerotinia borealis F-4128]
MFALQMIMQLLAIAILLFTSVFADPIKRNDNEVTPVAIPGLFGLFTSVATSALTTGELVSQILLTGFLRFSREGPRCSRARGSPALDSLM